MTCLLRDKPFLQWELDDIEWFVNSELGVLGWDGNRKDSPQV